MNIIVYTRHSRQPGSFQLRGWQLGLILLVLLVALPGAGLLIGNWAGESQVRSELLPEQWREEMGQSRTEVAQATRQAREEMNALAQRLALLQAQSIRLNALGQRLVDMAELDEGEFNFSQPPGVGGPDSDAGSVGDLSMPDFLQTLDQLAQDLDNREQRLLALESYYLNHNLGQEVIPAGRPVAGGWMSSGFGVRTDPFTGRRAAHRGMDFAGKEGTEIQAVGSGVVTWSGDRFSYGNMVEINHGNGYITRYAHNKKNLVKAGDVVEKGQLIALLGSTGRSTAPHVHFEIIKNGRSVDPAKYVRAAR